MGSRFDEQLATKVALGTPRRFVTLVDFSVSPSEHEAVALVILNADSGPYPMISYCQATLEGWSEDELTEAEEHSYVRRASGWDVWASIATGRGTPGATVRVCHAGRRPHDTQVGDFGWYFDVAWYEFKPKTSADVAPSR